MKDEALKLALEALGLVDDDIEWQEHSVTRKVVLKAINAIKQALAAPVQEPIGYLFQHEETGLTTVVDVQQVEWGFEKNNPRHQKIGPVYTTPPAAQPAPVQEPVACVIDGDLYFHHEIDWEDLAYQGHGVELLYTTPPAAQRQWVGLTNDEINEFAAGCQLGNSVQGAIFKAQAKIKEKNNGL